MTTCSVDGCRSQSGQHVTFFEFPTSRTLRRRWLDAINVSQKESIDALVCSNHFLEDEYESVRGKVRLRGKVVPSVFKHQQKEIPTPTTEQSTAVTTSDTKETSNVSISETTNKNNVPISDTTKTKNSSISKTSKEVKPSKRRKLRKKRRSRRLTQYSDTESDIESERGEAAREVNGEAEKRFNGDILQEDKRPPTVDHNDIEELITNYQIENKTSERDKERLTETVTDHHSAEDIEDIVANYQIENKTSERDRERLTGVGASGTEEHVDFGGKDPVFIEISVGQDGNPKSGSAAADDCLMVLESVQVDVDPMQLLFDREGDEGAGGDGGAPGETVEIEDDDRAPSSVPKPKQTVTETVVLDDDDDDTQPRADPISLMTSSDSDDVIVQEPHVDTVEVSDEDEDDVPLGRLLPAPGDKLPKSLWGTAREYYCVHCHFTTVNKTEFNLHQRTLHSTVLEIHTCSTCGYTTPSKTHFTRHRRKHKEEKRYRCHRCDYKARHKMSLVYHLKSHEENECYKCNVCGFTSEKRMLHGCGRNDAFKCTKCSFKCRKKCDLDNHIAMHRHG